jgi:hypothetical protein
VRRITNQHFDAALVEVDGKILLVERGVILLFLDPHDRMVHLCPAQPVEQSGIWKSKSGYPIVTRLPMND